MYSQQWYLALALQGMISLTAFLCAVIALRVRWLEALVAVLIFNAMPLVPVPGFKTPLYVHDFLVPVMGMVVLMRQRSLSKGLAVLALLAIFLWPILGIANGITKGVVGYLWITFIYRRFGLMLFLLAGACSAPRISLRHIVDTYVLIWIGMASVGLMQYLGFLDVDFLAKNVAAFGGETVFRDMGAQRGFLGLVRVSTGACSGAMATYCVAQLMLERRAGTVRVVAYTAGIVLSVIVVLFSGSRSGVLACGGGLVYVGVASLRLARHVRTARFLIFGAAALVAVTQMIAPALGVISRRLERSTQTQSFQTRVITQQKVLAYVFSNADAAAIGMGFDTFVFQRYSGAPLSHAHSEYLQILWSSGVPGLVLYLLLLYALLRGMRPFHGNEPDVLGVAMRGMFVVGLIVGLSEGNLLNVTPMQFTFGMFMLFAFGLRFGQVRTHLAQWRAWWQQRAALARRPTAAVPLGDAVGA